MNDSTVIDDGSKGIKTPSDDKTSSASEEANKTSIQGVFDAGFGKGIEKGQKELLEQLGVDGVDDLKAVLTSHKEREDAAKSTEQKLADVLSFVDGMKTKYAETEAKLESYVGRDKDKAQKLYDSLSDDDKAAFDTMEIPLEKATPVLERFTSKPTKKKVGGQVSPSPENVNTGTSQKSMDEMLDAFKKDGLSRTVRAAAEDIMSDDD